MAIIILVTTDKIAMKDGIEIRSFNEGEIHELAPWNEEHLIALGIAKKAIPADAETGAAVSEPEPEPETAEPADTAPVEAAEAPTATAAPEAAVDAPSEAPVAAAAPVEAEVPAEAPAAAE